ncbi:hypothetical protein AHiyo1_24180 [Arthrobacter sp. Hiyo1]|nr:hypothetical protein AHiyo1_24180 [Arthrobacter sp. Hiyo1]
MSESLVLTALPRAFSSWLKARPHMRRNAIPNAMNRIVEMAPRTSMKYLRRVKTSATHAR